MIKPTEPLNNVLEIGLYRDSLNAYADQLKVELGKALVKMKINLEYGDACSDDRFANAREDVLYIIEQLDEIEQMKYNFEVINSILES